MGRVLAGKRATPCYSWRVEHLRGTVVIPNWNGGAALRRCLASLAGQELAGGFETIVVDNGSTDSSEEVLREYADRVRVIRNPRNNGYGRANDQGAEQARGSVLYLLNSDVELLAPNVLELLAQAVEDPRVGLAGPKLLNQDGSLQPACAPHPGILNALVVASGIHRLLPDETLRRVAPQFWSHDRTVDTDWLLGASMAIRTDLYREIGGIWDYEYGEDQDLAYRVRQRGLTVRFVEPAPVMHIGNYSLSQHRNDVQRAVYVANAELCFLRVHYPRARAAAIRAIVGCGYAARAVLHRIAGHRERAAIFHSMARAYASARAGRAQPA